MRLTTEEAFVKTLQAHGIRDAFDPSHRRVRA